MIEPIIYAGTGFLVGGLLFIGFIPVAHAHAVRLTQRRLEAMTPIPMAEINAGKDRLRAEFAMSTRRLEVSVERKSAEVTGQLATLAKKGEAIVTTGADGKTLPCAICHGPDLKGLGDVPPIIGRSPMYIYRQLNDIKIGTRNGAMVPLMKGVVEKLTDDDMIGIAAYLVSKTP